MRSKYSRSEEGPFPWKVHPIWRGIGCIFLVIIPIISFGLSDFLLTEIEELLPELLARSLSILGVGEFENFLGRLSITVFLSILLFILLSLFGSVLFSLMGGKKQEKQINNIKNKISDD